MDSTFPNFSSWSLIVTRSEVSKLMMRKLRQKLDLRRGFGIRNMLASFIASSDSAAAASNEKDLKID
jgi:hypothetical protein